jgi:hypothetical protein
MWMSLRKTVRRWRIVVPLFVITGCNGYTQVVFDGPYLVTKLEFRPLDPYDIHNGHFIAESEFLPQIPWIVEGPHTGLHILCTGTIVASIRVVSLEDQSLVLFDEDVEMECGGWYDIEINRDSNSASTLRITTYYYSGQ